MYSESVSKHLDNFKQEGVEVLELKLELLDELLNTRETSRLACQIHLSDELDGIPITVAPAE